MTGLEVALLTIGGLTALLILDCLHMVALWKFRKNRFEVLRSDQRVFSVRTDFGDFTLDRPKQIFIAKTSDGSEEIPFARIDRFDFAFRAEQAPWNKWIWGAKPHEDVLQWYVVSIMAGDRRIPLFEVGQYLPSRPLFKEIFAAQTSALTRLGLLEDAEERAREVLKGLQGAFAAAGCPITLAPRSLTKETAL